MRNEDEISEKEKRKENMMKKKEKKKERKKVTRAVVGQARYKYVASSFACYSCW